MAALQKEEWHLEFEEEGVNDCRWSCNVVAAVEAEMADVECVTMYTQAVATRLRKRMVVFSVDDVAAVLKAVPAGPPKGADVGPPPPRPRDIVNLAARYATTAEGQIQLPPFLMAAVVKHMILDLKITSSFERKLDAAKAKKKRMWDAKERFVRLYGPKREEVETEVPQATNVLGLTDPIDDAPLGSPEVYIMLVGFYDPQYFAEMLRLKIPLVAIVRIQGFTEILLPGMQSKNLPPPPSNQGEPPKAGKPKLLYFFWADLGIECGLLATTTTYKDFSFIQYQVPAFNEIESKEEAYRTIFDDLTDIQYSSFSVYRQHQNYLQQIYVQPVVESSAPLDLSQCQVYQLLADALECGSSNSVVLVMTAMLEQLAQGVPEMEYRVIEYVPEATDYYDKPCPETQVPEEIPQEVQEEENDVLLVTPCVTCRGEKMFICPAAPCIAESDENESMGEAAVSFVEPPDYGGASTAESGLLPLDFIAAFLKESIEERKGLRKPRMPFVEVILNGDTVSLLTYHLDNKIFDPDITWARLFHRATLPLLWESNPELPPAEKAYHQYQFFRLWEKSSDTQRTLRFNLHVALCLRLMGSNRADVFTDSEDGSTCAWSVVEEPTRPYQLEFQVKRKRSEALWETGLSVQGERTNRGMPGRVTIKNTRKGLKTLNSATDTERVDNACSRVPNAVQFETSPSEAIHNTHLQNMRQMFESTDITMLIEPDLICDKEEFDQLVRKINVYESLEPRQILQIIEESQHNFNTVQYFHFKPTDSIILAMSNDHDHRGMFNSVSCSDLATPVGLRDFFTFVYAQIGRWLHREEKMYQDFEMAKVVENQKGQTKEVDEMWHQLTCEVLQMTEADRTLFLAQKLDKVRQAEALVVKEEDIQELPQRNVMPKPNRKTFVSTNLSSVQVQVRTVLSQFFSRDGSVVTVTTDTWLYSMESQVKLELMKNDAKLYYHYTLNSELEKAFHVVTASGLIVAFAPCDQRDDDNLSTTVQNSEYDGGEAAQEFHFMMKATWPTGLVVEPVPVAPADLYIRQGYLTSNGPGLGKQQERYRCFLRNGSVLIFRENGSVEILTASSTKYGCYDPTCPVPPPVKIEDYDYDVVTPLGDYRLKTNRVRPPPSDATTRRYKLLFGEDPETREVFYRREDGTACMLWPDGKLVVTFRDGTRITSMPECEGEATTEWSDEEKEYFLNLEEQRRWKAQASSTKPSRSILRHIEHARLTNFDASDLSNFHIDPFIIVSCSYLMEHPKYSAVSYYVYNQFVEVLMPDKVCMQMYPDGTYSAKLGGNVELDVQENSVEFQARCPRCAEPTMSYLNFEGGMSGSEDSNPLLCRTVDHFEKRFLVFRDGTVSFDEEVLLPEDTQRGEKTVKQCEHSQSAGLKERCFILERNLTGIELIHDDVLDALEASKPEANAPFTVNTPLHRTAHEEWTMDYLHSESLPTNLRKQDLYAYDEPKRSEEYRLPFPKRFQVLVEPARRESVPIKVPPKAILVRTLQTIQPSTRSILNDLERLVREYKNRAQAFYDTYSSHVVPDGRDRDSRYTEMRLRKIALCAAASLKPYDHNRIKTPSTEHDIHFLAHRLNVHETFSNDSVFVVEDLWPRCKQLPTPLPFAGVDYTIKETASEDKPTY